MPVIRMTLVENPGSNVTIMAPLQGKPAFRGEGDTDFLCGKEACSTALLKGMVEGQVSFENIFFKCSTCGRFNVLP